MRQGQIEDMGDTWAINEVFKSWARGDTNPSWHWGLHRFASTCFQIL